jgi:hypothetical protein
VIRLGQWTVIAVTKILDWNNSHAPVDGGQTLAPLLHRGQAHAQTCGLVFDDNEQLSHWCLARCHFNTRPADDPCSNFKHRRDSYNTTVRHSTLLGVHTPC